MGDLCAVSFVKDTRPDESSGALSFIPTSSASRPVNDVTLLMLGIQGWSFNLSALTYRRKTEGGVDHPFRDGYLESVVTSHDVMHFPESVSPLHANSCSF